MRRILALSVALLFLAACGDDDSPSSSGGGSLDVAGTLANGTGLTDIQTHWTSSGTSGPLLMVSFLSDGTGQLNFGNDDLYSHYSRSLRNFTWVARASDEITLSIEVEELEEPLELTLLSVTGSLESESMSALVEDGDGTVFTLQFTLGTGPPPCC